MLIARSVGKAGYMRGKGDYVVRCENVGRAGKECEKAWFCGGFGV